MVVKSKEYFEKCREVKKMTNLKNTFYEDKEIQDIMKNYYQIKRNLIISFLLPIQHNFILSRLSSVQKSI